MELVALAMGSADSLTSSVLLIKAASTDWANAKKSRWMGHVVEGQILFVPGVSTAYAVPKQGTAVLARSTVV